jgi:hypothetical protein
VCLLPKHLYHCSPKASPPRSCRCVFLGYSSDYKGYRCLDLTTNHLLISRHVVFDESSFPFASSDPPPDDLDSLFSSSPAVCPIAPPYPSSIAGTSEPVVAPHPAPTPPPEPCVAPARTTRGPDVFVCATRGLSFTLHQAPPWCTSNDIRPLCQSPLASGRRSTTPSPWLVTPAARTPWSPVVLSGSPSPWIVYSSPPPPLPRHCLRSRPLSVARSQAMDFKSSD